MAGSKKKKKILVADDDPAIRRIVEIALGAEGLEVIPAVDGEEAFRKALTERPHPILLDIMMPKMNGLEVCEKLKADETTAKIPIGFLTGQKDFDSYRQAQKLGGVLYVTKPFEPKRLVHFVGVLFMLVPGSIRLSGGRNPVCD